MLKKFRNLLDLLISLVNWFNVIYNSYIKYRKEFQYLLRFFSVVKDTQIEKEEKKEKEKVKVEDDIKEDIYFEESIDESDEEYIEYVFYNFFYDPQDIEESYDDENRDDFAYRNASFSSYIVVSSINIKTNGKKSDIVFLKSEDYKMWFFIKIAKLSIPFLIVCERHEAKSENIFSYHFNLFVDTNNITSVKDYIIHCYKTKGFSSKHLITVYDDVFHMKQFIYYSIKHYLWYGDFFTNVRYFDDFFSRYRGKVRYSNLILFNALKKLLNAKVTKTNFLEYLNDKYFMAISIELNEKYKLYCAQDELFISDSNMFTNLVDQVALELAIDINIITKLQSRFVLNNSKMLAFLSDKIYKEMERTLKNKRSGLKDMILDSDQVLGLILYISLFIKQSIIQKKVGFVLSTLLEPISKNIIKIAKINKTTVYSFEDAMYTAHLLFRLFVHYLKENKFLKLKSLPVKQDFNYKTKYIVKFSNKYINEVSKYSIKDKWLYRAVFLKGCMFVKPVMYPYKDYHQPINIENTHLYCYGYLLNRVLEIQPFISAHKRIKIDKNSFKITDNRFNDRTKEVNILMSTGLRLDAMFISVYANTNIMREFTMNSYNIFFKNRFKKISTLHSMLRNLDKKDHWVRLMQKKYGTKEGGIPVNLVDKFERYYKDTINSEQQRAEIKYKLQKVCSKINALYLRVMERMFIESMLLKKQTNEIISRVIYYVSFIEWRGRKQLGGVLNNQSSRLLRNIMVFEKAVSVDVNVLKDNIKYTNLVIPAQCTNYSSYVIKHKSIFIDFFKNVPLKLKKLLKDYELMFLLVSMKINWAIKNGKPAIFINNIFYSDWIASGMMLMLLMHNDEIFFDLFGKGNDYYLHQFYAFYNELKNKPVVDKVRNRYNKLMSSVAKDLVVKFDDETYSNYKEEKDKNVKHMPEKMTEVEKRKYLIEILDQIMLKYPISVRRAIVKHACMTMTYGAAHLTLINKLKTGVKENLSKEDAAEIPKYFYQYFAKFLKQENNYCFLETTYLANIYFRKNKEVELIVNNGGYSFNQVYYKRHLVRKYIKILNKEQPLKYYDNSNEIDVSKTVRSTYVNLIHGMEAEVCGYLILNMNTDIITIHDCYGVNFNNVTKLKNMFRAKLAYNERHSIFWDAAKDFWGWGWDNMTEESTQFFLNMEKGNMTVDEFWAAWAKAMDIRAKRIESIPTKYLIE